MAKVNRFIVAIKNVLNSNGVELQKGTRTTKSTTRYLLKLFSLIDDPRVPGMIDYPLDYIILIAFLSVLAGANTWMEIQDFGNAKRNWLKKFLDVKKYGIPSHDTFCRVFGLIETNQLQNIIVNVLIENLNLIKSNLHIQEDENSYRLICIDGKEENGTGRRFCKTKGEKVRNTQTLHVYDYTNQVCLVSEAIEKKTNEIPTAQRILRTMDLNNTICTFDALHMQKETIAIIQSKKGHYVGGLKGNQQGLFEEASASFTETVIQQLKKSRRKKQPVYLKTIDHAHGQEEIREYYLVLTNADTEHSSKWQGLRSFVMCIKTVTPDIPGSDSSTEIRYYASDLIELDVIAEAIRAHWSVEQFHWQLDVSFCQDDNSTMNITAYDNLSLMNKMALHLIQLMKLIDSKTSVNRMRKRFAWNFEESMELLLSYLSEEAILNTIGAIPDQRD